MSYLIIFPQKFKDNGEIQNKIKTITLRIPKTLLGPRGENLLKPVDGYFVVDHPSLKTNRTPLISSKNYSFYQIGSSETLLNREILNLYLDLIMNPKYLQYRVQGMINIVQSDDQIVNFSVYYN